MLFRSFTFSGRIEPIQIDISKLINVVGYKTNDTDPGDGKDIEYVLKVEGTTGYADITEKLEYDYRRDYLP